MKSDKVYDYTNVLKVRLDNLINSESAEYFKYPKYITRDEYIKELILTKEGKKAQIIDFNINYVDDRFAKALTKIYSKLLFDYSTSLKRRAESQTRNVFQYNLNGELIKIWHGLKEISKAGMNISCISQCCNKKIHTSYGSIWRYEGREF